MKYSFLKRKRKINILVTGILFGSMIFSLETIAQENNLSQQKARSANPIFKNLGKAYRAPAIAMEDYWL